MRTKHIISAGLSLVVAGLGVGALAPSLNGQKAVQVAQAPELSACMVLRARLTTGEVHKAISASDTGRVQAALNHCSPGRAVVLKKAGSKNSFLSAPLILPRGVTLSLDDGVILLASLNPRDYDSGPRSCGGIRKERIAQCKPFLFAYQAAYSGVVGSGTIDGQGGTPLQNAHRSWWDLVRNQQVSVPDLVSSYESQGFRLIGVTLRGAAGHHVSLFKTIGATVANLKIDSSLDAATSSALLLSNSPEADIARTWIRAPGEAIAIQASILGPKRRTSAFRRSPYLGE